MLNVIDRVGRTVAGGSRDIREVPPGGPGPHPPEAEDTAGRWRTCLHEAGHAVVGRALLGHSTQATVIEAGWGLANLGDGGGVPKSDESAIAVAAGLIAEEMARHYRPPALPIVLPSSATCPGRVARLKARASKVMSDDEALARWCIAGYESRPIRWARRYDWVCQQAATAVVAHRREILAVAQELFVRGVITLPAEGLLAAGAE